MSHVATIDITINELLALKSACAEMTDVQFVENQHTYKWYGRSVGDYSLPKGMTAAMLGKCDHVIRVAGVEYEIGVVKLADGTYTLAFDFWGPGQGLLQKFGEKLGKLTQMYGVHRATLEAQRKGMRVVRTTSPNGSIRLAISGGALR